jgi:MFS superfamily sulfate permease-like transporter
MGAPVASLFTSVSDNTASTGATKSIRLPATCFFGNVISFKKIVDGVHSGDLELNFSSTVHVDHTFMHEVRALERDVSERGRRVSLIGLDRLVPVSDHHAASRSVPTERFLGRALVRG